jgi:hypothetical protein
MRRRISSRRAGHSAGGGGTRSPTVQVRPMWQGGIPVAARIALCPSPLRLLHRHLPPVATRLLRTRKRRRCHGNLWTDELRRLLGWKQKLGAHRFPLRRRILAALAAGRGPSPVVVGGFLYPLRQLHLRRLGNPISGNGAGRGSEAGRRAQG